MLGELNTNLGSKPKLPTWQISELKIKNRGIYGVQVIHCY